MDCALPAGTRERGPRHTIAARHNAMVPVPNCSRSANHTMPGTASFQRAAGLVGGHHFAGDGNGIAPRSRIDVEALIQKLKILVELAEKLACVSIVFESQHELICVGPLFRLARR